MTIVLAIGTIASLLLVASAVLYANTPPGVRLYRRASESSAARAMPVMLPLVVSLAWIVLMVEDYPPLGNGWVRRIVLPFLAALHFVQSFFAYRTYRQKNAARATTVTN
jgi:hypothetical protein